MRRGVEEHLVLVLTVKVDELGGRIPSAVEVTRAPFMKARLRPLCDEMSRRTTSSPQARSSKTASIAA